MPDWRRTFYTIWVTQFITVSAFYFVTPFIPFYVQDLGIHDVGQVALWAGLASSMVSVGLAVVSPAWGVLADRYGRKLMFMRAIFAGVIIMSLMGLVTNVQQLVFLRLLQGIFSGTIAASTTLVASIAPPDRRGSALGSLQTAIFLGTTLGPLFGATMAESFGYRPTFWITGGGLLISGLLVTFLVHENFHPTAVVRGRQRASLPGVRLLLSSGGVLLSIFVARILLRAGTVVITPVLPLLVQSLLPAGAHAALVTGLASGAGAVGGALGAPIVGGWGDRWGHRRLLIFSGLAAALTYVPQALAPDAASLAFWQLLNGFAVGGTLATVMALLSQATPDGREGMIFGLDASATGIANAAGPMMGAVSAAAINLRAPFLLSAAILALGTLVVFLRVPVHPVPFGVVPRAQTK